MDAELQKAIEEGEFVPQPKDAKVQAKEISTRFPEFDTEDVNPKKLWAFGPDGNGPNWLMDATRGVQFLNEIKESCVSGFQWGSRSGPLAQEMLRGVICKLLDVTLHADAIHRGQGQLMPCFRQVLFATIYTASPTLMEPMYIADISCPIDETGSVYSTLALRRGLIVEEIPRVGTPMTAIRAHLPVNESFGFTGALRAATGGKAFPQCSFDHWAVMTGDPVRARTRRGLGGHHRSPPLTPPLLPCSSRPATRSTTSSRRSASARASRRRCPRWRSTTTVSTKLTPTQRSPHGAQSLTPPPPPPLRALSAVALGEATAASRE